MTPDRRQVANERPETRPSNNGPQGERPPKPRQGDVAVPLCVGIDKGRVRERAGLRKAEAGE